MAVVAADAGDNFHNIEAGGSWGEAANPDLLALAETVALCNEANLAAESGSATEMALLEFSAELGVDIVTLRADAPIIGLRNRNHVRHWMGTEHRREHGTEIAIKGAPEEVLALSSSELVDGSLRPLDTKRRAAILAANQMMARRGLRVLGVARGDGAFGEGPIGELLWLGMVGLADPIRPEAREAIAVLHQAGVRTLLITGDQAPTALSIAETLALSRSGIINVVEGSQLASLNDDAVAELASRTSAFARVSPSEKLRIVQAMQRAGKRVAMIGDGVNDGPALRAASVGIAIGAKDNSVAREVADIVIGDDDLADLARVVARGRATEDNVRSAMRYLIATNLSEVIVTVVEALRGRAELETPMELFWLNLVTDIMPALGLALAEPRGDVMARPPAAAGAPLFDRQEVRTLVGDGSGIAFAALAAHFAEIGLVGPGPQTRSATFLSLALSQIAYAWVLRDRSPNAGQALQISERRLEAFLVAAGALLALPFLAPPMQRVLGIAPLSPGRLTMASVLAVGSFAVAEARRAISARRPTAAASQASPPAQTR